MVVLFSCQKKDAIITNVTDQPPKAIAGDDRFIFLPADSIILNGKAVTQHEIMKVEWKKITGPNANILSPASLKTHVTALQHGVYQFELNVLDNKGRFGKDTVQVTVISNDISSLIDTTNGPGFVIFKNLNWTFPWYATLEINNLDFYILQNTISKVYIQRNVDTTWTQIKHAFDTTNNSMYSYFIDNIQGGTGVPNNRSLYIFYYGSNTSDNPNVKIEL